MKLAVTGATGNIGSSLIEACCDEDEIDEIVGIARRRPTWDPPKTRWVEADVTADDLVAHFEGADAVVHLAWAIQPSRDFELLARTNVEGSRRVFQAAASAGVPRIVYASSVGAYAPGPKDRRVDEGWPVEPVESSTYSRHKVAVERELDRFEARHPEVSVVRMRPGLIFKADAASEIRRLFAGSLLPGFIADRRFLPIAPSVAGIRFQAVHSLDVGRAFLQGARCDASGAFNLAADPPIGTEQISEVIGAPPFEISWSSARRLADLGWKARLQPSEAGWLDLAMEVPLMSTDRARQELDWKPAYSSLEAMGELLDGLRKGSGHSAPHLAGTGIVTRLDELRTGQGKRQWVRSRSRQIRKYLTDVHAIERQALIQMRFAPSLAGDPGLAAAFSEHRRETESHEARVEARLTELGGRPARVKDAAGTAGGLGMLAFARSQVDSPGKLAAHAFSYEHMERAAYEILAAYADRGGDGETAALARQVAAEERAMAWRISERFDQAVAASFAQVRSDPSLAVEHYLADAHALETQGEEFFGRSGRIVDDQDLRRIIREGLDSGRRQRKLIRSVARSPGSWQRRLKGSPLRAGGVGVHAFLAVQPDRTTKVAGFGYAFLNLLVAANELLNRAGAASGQPEVADLAARRASETRTLAERIAPLWERMGGS